jgi:hypothetical protein
MGLGDAPGAAAYRPDAAGRPRALANLALAMLCLPPPRGDVSGPARPTSASRTPAT